MSFSTIRNKKPSPHSQRSIPKCSPEFKSHALRRSRQRVRCFVRAFVFASLFVVAPQVHADVIVSAGTAELRFNEDVSLRISAFDAYFDDLASRSQSLSDPAPVNAGFNDNGGSVTLIDPNRPHGDIPLAGDGRARQTTTLTIEDTLSIALGDGSVRSVVVNISADVWQRAYALQNRHLSADGKGGGM
ncbi:hypothetical protein [Rosistilla oblonga]|uniref:hypothetical protein n=1 Tax=Rosistilla oblonga TaxID=2527990 RepID=UPI003A97F6FF